MTTPDQPPVQPSAPPGRRAIWLWVAATAAALAAAVTAGVTVTHLSSALLPRTDGPSATSSPFAEAQIECVNIRRAYNAWDTHDRPRTAADFSALDDVQLEWLMEDGDELANAVTGYDSQASRTLALAVAEYKSKLAAANLAVVLGVGMDSEQAQALASAAAALERAYQAWESATCS